MVVQPIAGLWQACAGAGKLALQVMHAPHEEMKEVVFDTPFVLIGRWPDCDLVLQDNQVSRRHALLQVIGGRVWCVDLMSRTGVRCNGRVEKATWIDSSTALRVGPYRLRLQNQPPCPEAGCNPMVRLSPEAATSAGYALEFVNGSGPSRARLDRTLTLVGNAEACKIRLTCSSVSPVHCALLQSGESLWAIDLLGRRGIFLNGMRVRCAQLVQGDCLQVGTFKMVIHCEGPGMLDVSAVPVLQRSIPRPATLSALQLATTSLTHEDIPPPAAISSKLSGSALVLPAASSEITLGNAALNPDQTLIVTLMQQFSTMQQQMVEQFQQSTLFMLQMVNNMHREQRDMVTQELRELQRINRNLDEVQNELARHPVRAEANAVAQAASAAETPRVMEAPLASINAISAPKKASGSETAPDPTDRKTVPTSALAPPSGQDAHLFLSQRFTELQKEKQSRWQKLLGGLLGN